MSERDSAIGRDLVGVALAVVTLLGAMKTLDWALAKSDPRRAMVGRMRREAGPRDLLVITDEAPELVAAAAPMAAVWGGINTDDLGPVRRVYGLGNTVAALAPLLGRFGPGQTLYGDGRAVMWELATIHGARVVFDANLGVGTRITAQREGGADAGPCPYDGTARLVCNGPDWNQPRVEEHHFDGVALTCLYAHPQADGRLVFTFTDIAPARAVMGAFGIDDAGIFPGGADVTAEVIWQPEGRPRVRQVLVAHNVKGVTPYRFEVPRAAARATVSITTPNAGARQFCFTLRATE
ncbi:MAG: hypothetical protein JNK72_18670 [Myxococcales bacterium]|nr:hypothetical protein [Myxococcales bacterium]